MMKVNITNPASNPTEIEVVVKEKNTGEILSREYVQPGHFITVDANSNRTIETEVV